jgi:multicomponent Na+:H+ antiporter subunit D
VTDRVTDIILLAPVLIPLATAALGLVRLRHKPLQRVIGVGGSAALLAAGLLLLSEVRARGILTTELGNWPAPFGIVFAADLFSAVMVCLTGFMSLAVAIYAVGDTDAPRVRFGFFPLFHLLLMGVCGAFLTGDVFNLYVWFEVMLMASFVLLVLGGEQAQIEGAVKYVTLNLLASVLFLSAVGILYGKVGTLNMADLAVKIESFPHPRLATALSLMFLVSFGIKAGLFPLFFWLPAAYHTPPVAVTTIFSALLTKVGIYAIVRMFTLIFDQDTLFIREVLLWLAALTMITGVLGAVAQYDLRRLLSFHIISQIGYLLMGLALAVGAAHTDAAVLALAAMIYFMIHVVVAKSALFLISGIVHRFHHTYDLIQLGGLYASHRRLSVLFLLSAMSLAGIPPLSGFVAKFALISAGLQLEEYWIVGAALGVSILTLFSMTKIWAEAFWKVAPCEEPPLPRGWGNDARWAMYGPTAVLAGLCLLLGILAEPLLSLCLDAARQLLEPDLYIDAVLGDFR